MLASRDILDRFVDLGFSNKDWKVQKRKEEGRQKSMSPVNQKIRFNSTRKSPLYHNCQLQAPDGQVIFFCVFKIMQKKLNYKRKRFAEQV